MPEPVNLTVYDPNRQLTDQEMAFCWRYRVNFRPKAAAKAVGLSQKRAEELLADPAVLKYMDQLREEEYGESLIDQRMYDHELLNELMPRVKGEVAVPHWDKDLGQADINQYNPAGHIKATEMLGKRAGAISPSGNASKGGVQVNINLNAMGVSSDVEVIEGELDQSSE